MLHVVKKGLGLGESEMRFTKDFIICEVLSDQDAVCKDYQGTGGE